MKNQYFGDVNDYQKYGLLRILSGYGTLKTGVCWMLTANDERSDGEFVNYLDSPLKWRGFDPELYDSLSRAVKIDKKRQVDQAEIQGILPNTIFFEKLCTFIICSGISLHFFLQVLHKYFITSFRQFIYTINC